MRRLLPALLLACFTVSCAPLYVDSPGALTALIGALRHEGTVGPLSDPGVSVTDEYLLFYPEIQDPTVTANHGIDPTRGFVTWADPENRSSRSAHLAYVMPDPANGGRYVQFEGWSGAVGWEDIPRYRFFPVKIGPSPAAPYVAVIQLDSGTTTPPVSETIYSVDTMGRTFAVNPPAYGDIDNWIQTTAGFAGHAVGICRNPQYSSSGDYSFWLYRSDSSSTHAEYLMSLQTFGAGTVPERGGFSFPDIGTPLRVLYFHTFGAANRSYAQVQGPNNAWTGWRWDSTAVIKSLPAGMHKLSCLLSTGDLFSIEDGAARVYDQDGNLTASFAVGPLRFVSEDYIDGVLSIVFCLPDRGTEGLYFDIYSIKTADLKSLAR